MAQRHRKLLFGLVAAVVAGLAVWAAVGLGFQVQDNLEQDQLFDRLRKATQAKAVTDLSEGSKDSDEILTETDSADSQGTGHDIELLQAENPNCVGWISIEDTELDYPVMQTIDDPEYYLKRNFEGDYNRHGVPFMDARCGLGSADNLIIYGHNMADGTMFSTLHKYEQYSYYEEHPVITWETASGVDYYQVAGVMRVSGTAYETQWSIYNCIYLNDVEFAEMVDHISRDSLYNTGVVPVYGDKLMTLSTCESLYSQNDERLVVVAVKQ